MVNDMEGKPYKEQLMSFQLASIFIESEVQQQTTPCDLNS